VCVCVFVLRGVRGQTRGKQDGAHLAIDLEAIKVSVFLFLNASA